MSLSLQEKQKAQKLILTANVVIMGSASEEFLEKRIAQNKLTLRYSERIYKGGYIHTFSPRGHQIIKKFHVHSQEKPVYMLCASSFTAGDFALHGAYRNKCFKWGYFPEVKEYDIDKLINQKKNKQCLELLWVGRLITLKHPKLVIELAAKLKKEGYLFVLNLIGEGVLKDPLKRLVKQYHLKEQVHLLGSISPEKVRQHMEQADIFLFTSDYREGWGAVLNESMNSACAVVASSAIGSVDFLIQT